MNSSNVSNFSWLNDYLHTYIGILVITESYIVFHRYPSMKSTIKGIWIFGLTYMIRVYLTKYFHNVWIYTLIEDINLPLQAIAFLGLVAVAKISYIFGAFLNTLFWYKHVKESRKLYGVKEPTSLFVLGPLCSWL